MPTSSNSTSLSQPELELGKTYQVPYPFVREEVELSPTDPEATHPNIVRSWRPGVDMERDEFGATYGSAEAMGEMLLTVIDVHKPGKFPTRVFYTRQWRDPSGRVFGKSGLSITTLASFRGRLRGYRHPFWLDGKKPAHPGVSTSLKELYAMLEEMKQKA